MAPVRLLLMWSAMMTVTPAIAENSPDNQPGVLEKRLSEAITLLDEKALNLDAPRMAEQAVQSMLKAVDPKGGVFTAQDVQALFSRQNGHVFSAGITLSFTGETVTVKHVVNESPAQQAGVQPDDIVLRINDQALDGLIPPETISLLRGTGPRDIRLDILRNGENQTCSFQLAPVQLPAIEVIEFFPEELVYVMLNGLFEHSGDELTALMKQWKAQRKFGLIVDLRNAAGRDAESVSTLANALAAPHTRLYGFQDKRGEWIQEVTSDDTERLALPVMILVNENTSEASELLTAVCKNAVKGCMVLGTETAGAPMLREMVPLSDGSIMYLATRILVAGDKGRYDGRRGIQPDIAVSDNWHSETYEPDPESSTLDEEKEDKVLRDRLRGDGPLSRATDLLLGLKALNIQPGGIP